MYSPAYGYGNPAGQPYNGAPQGQNPQMQPGPGSSQPHQSMMYNQQQYPMGPGGGAFTGASNPSAMIPGTAGPAGMMQSTALPQMPANSQSMSPFPICLYLHVTPHGALACLAGALPRFVLLQSLPHVRYRPSTLYVQRIDDHVTTTRFINPSGNEEGFAVVRCL